MFPSLFDQLGVLDVACPPKAAYREGSPQRSRWASLPLSGALGDGKVPGLNPAIKAQPALVRVIGVLIKRDSQRAVLVCISRTALGAAHPRHDIVFICDDHRGFESVGESVLSPPGSPTSTSSPVAPTPSAVPLPTATMARF